ncbi:conserved hypothetical protein [Candidatus Desulfarcum epimagneticum]|uniref:Radical SAM core domain-containing protein n=1 Tax=uncultured Desulfobacteraceae bacterium TaxID=218296 RepID=A0A484HLC9_9BACT|nr:conserved hypothetical protein [uncultured Desulfobacteraceae bacterium]
MSAFRFAARHSINNVLQKASYTMDRPFCHPTQIILRITDRCNFRCVMCGVWKSPGKRQDELRTDELKSILLDFKSWLKRSFYVQFTGGEVFLRKDMLDIIRFASSNGIKTLVNSNGSLIDKEMAKKIADSGLDYLTISFDSVDPEIFDGIRGKGAYKQTISGILHANAHKREGMIVGVSAIIMDRNMDQMAPLVRWVEEKGLDRVGFHALNKSGKALSSGPSLNQSLVSDAEELDATIDSLIHLKTMGSPIINSVNSLKRMKNYYRNPFAPRRGSKCMAGFNNLFVLPDGDVKLCNRMDSIGNIRRLPTSEIWRSQEANVIRKGIKNCEEVCLNKCLYGMSLLEKARLFFFLMRKGQYKET